MQDAESAFGSDSSSVLEWKPAEPVDVASAPATKKPLTALRVQVRDLSCFRSWWSGVKRLGLFLCSSEGGQGQQLWPGLHDIGEDLQNRPGGRRRRGKVQLPAPSLQERIQSQLQRHPGWVTDKLGSDCSKFQFRFKQKDLQQVHWLVPLWVQEWISRWRHWSWTDSPFYCSCGIQQDKKGVVIVVLFIDLELQPTWLQRNTWSSSISSCQVSQHRKVLFPACGRRVVAVWRHLWEELPKCSRVGRHGWGKAPCSRRLC